MVENFHETVNSFQFNVGNKRALGLSLESLFQKIQYTKNPAKVAWDTSQSIINDALAKGNELSQGFVVNYLNNMFIGVKGQVSLEKIAESTANAVSQEVQDIVNDKTMQVNEKIRKLLLDDKVNKSTIAKLLGLKYQRVKNVEKKLKKQQQK